MAEWDHAQTRQVDHVIGAFFLVRRDLFDVLGGFDERFFVYLEDLDFSYRARQAGWHSVYLADVQAFFARQWQPDADAPGMETAMPSLPDPDVTP